MMHFFRRKAAEDGLTSTQALITTVGFPRDLAGATAMGSKNEERGGWYSDLETLKMPNAEPDWTAPRWAMAGDIVLFYCTKTARDLVDALARKAAAVPGSDPRLIVMLDRARRLYPGYAGCIFACGRVEGPPTRLGNVGGHFASRIFAGIGDIHFFKHPLKADAFGEHVKIGQSTITPLYGEQFESIRRLLAAENKLPGHLAKARLGDKNLRAITPGTWDHSDILAAMRFIDEAQVRIFWLDHLLRALKDPGTTVLEECQCYRDGSPTGFADYCVSIGGRWVSVEAKLNIVTEHDILGQIRQYVGAERFTPTKGPQRGKEVDKPTSRLCLVADPSGVYPAQADGFIECRSGKPLWRREELTRAKAAEVRAWLSRQR